MVLLRPRVPTAGDHFVPYIPLVTDAIAYLAAVSIGVLPCPLSCLIITQFP